MTDAASNTRGGLRGESSIAQAWAIMRAKSRMGRHQIASVRGESKLKVGVISVSATALWVGWVAEPDDRRFHSTISSIHRPGAIHPTRYPGASVFDTDEQYSTLPVASNALHAAGRRSKNVRSPYASSSIKGMRRFSRSSTRARLRCSGI